MRLSQQLSGLGKMKRRHSDLFDSTKQGIPGSETYPLYANFACEIFLCKVNILDFVAVSAYRKVVAIAGVGEDGRLGFSIAQSNGLV